MSDSMGCGMCRYYSALREPREREDGAVIYGYCFATGTKDYNGNMGKGYAVFVPDSGVCEKFKRIYKKAEKAEESKRQMSLEDLSIERLKSENAALRERLGKSALGKCIYYINSVWNDATMTRKEEVCQGTVDYVCDNFVEVAGLVLKWDEVYFTREAAEARLAELKGGKHE